MLNKKSLFPKKIRVGPIRLAKEGCWKISEEIRDFVVIAKPLLMSIKLR